MPPDAPCPLGHAEGRTAGNRCKVCRRERAQAWRDANPGKVRARRLKWDAANAEKQAAQNRTWKDANRDAARSRYHGLTYGQIRARLAAQDGACAICKQTEPAVRRWHGDHDHQTGAFRAVLCHQCNCGIGMMRDDAACLRAAVDYLERHKALGSLL